MQRSKKLKSITLLFYNIFNAFLLYFILRGAFVVHGDGPGGFGEFIIKVFMLNISVLLFSTGFMSIRSINKKEGKNIKTNIFLCTLATVVLMLFCGIMVIDACTNNQGYCRNWTIHFQ
jgi:hypothetical protein